MTRLRLIAALLVCSCLGAGSARAQPAAESLGAQLVPDQRALLSRRERLLSLKLERLAAALTQVEHARAEVTLADASRLPIDEPLAAPHVSLVLQSRAPLPDRTVLELVRQAAPELAQAHITVTQTPSAQKAQAPESLREVGPFRVAAGSDGLLRVVLALLLSTNVVLALLLLSRRRGQRRVL